MYNKGIDILEFLKKEAFLKGWSITLSSLLYACGQLRWIVNGRLTILLYTGQGLFLSSMEVSFSAVGLPLRVSLR